MLCTQIPMVPAKMSRLILNTTVGASYKGILRLPNYSGKLNGSVCVSPVPPSASDNCATATQISQTATNTPIT